jgi:vancomycin resistance protein YoaR
MRRAVTVGLLALGVLAGIALALVAGFGVDSHNHRGRAMRHVSVGGRPVGGLGPAQLAAAVRAVAAGYESAPVKVDAPGRGFTTDTAALGLRVEEGPTAAAVMRAGRQGSLPGRVLRWVRSFLHPMRAPVEVSVRTSDVYAVVATDDPGPRTPAVEPSIKVEGRRLVAVAGKPGKGIDAADVIAALPHGADHGLPIRVAVGRGSVAPRFRMADAQRVAAEGESLLVAFVPVTSGTASARVPVATLRSWMRATPEADALKLTMDGAKAADDLGKLLPNAGTPPVETTFTLVDRLPQVVPGQPGTACCSPTAADVLLRALRRRPTGPVTLPLRRVDPKLTPNDAAQLGVHEVVSTFTTPHPCCAPRVSNIHRIADLVRGQVIKPGETFSVNEFVGPRTTAKGFVVDHVIEDGKFAEAVGGGVSQFGTTTFNAAFFAGLEIPEYQAHSIYISRYPYGREATLSYPHPDLKIKNVTPYGIMIWPTYTGTSLTVTFYSTHWVDAAQTGQTKGQRGPCTTVRTERTRRFLDGTVKVDHFGALYQPAEGVLCT